MSKFIVKVTNEKYRVVIPVDIRKLEDIKVGDFLEIDVHKIEKKKEQ